MHVYAFAAVVIAVLTTGSPAGHNVLSALAPHTLTIPAPVPGSTPTSVRPTPPSVPPSIKDILELRQAPGFAAPPLEIAVPAAPAALPPAVAPPVTDPLVAPAPAPAAPAAAIPPANQAVPPAPAAVSAPHLPAMTTIPLPPLVTGDDFGTVQWVETQIGTLRTWVPKTYTFHFEAMSQAPPPGVGSIGMGTLTGKTGQTQTIYMVVGAAPTLAVDSKKVIVAAAAVGIAGLLA